MAIAPALTIGFIVRSAFSSIAITELNGRPVLFTPSFRRASSWPMASHTSANTNGLDTLWIENRWVASPAATVRPSALDDAGAEEVRRDPGERRDVVGDDPVVDGPVSLVRLGQQPTDHLLPGQLSGRHVAVGQLRPHSAVMALSLAQERHGQQVRWAAHPDSLRYRGSVFRPRTLPTGGSHRDCSQMPDSLLLVLR